MGAHCSPLAVAAPRQRRASCCLGEDSSSLLGAGVGVLARSHQKSGDAGDCAFDQPDLVEEHWGLRMCCLSERFEGAFAPELEKNSPRSSFSWVHPVVARAHPYLAIARGDDSGEGVFQVHGRMRTAC